MSVKRTRATFIILGILWVSWGTAHNAYAYPEMVRHGYVNCTACHVSPSGGGVLTQYGRELSREVLSTAGKEGESDFAYGAVKLPEWLNAGGDVRVATTYRDSPTAREGRLILMQADLEAVLAYKKMLVAGTLGFREESQPKPVKDHIISRRHYVNYRPTDELSFRAGRFQPVFGINTPDHIIATKRGLGWDQGTETYNLESAWIGEKFNIYATGIFGRPDAPELLREKGAALSPSVALGESYKIGLSYFYGGNELGKRHVAGAFGILGFTPRFFLLTELDFQGQNLNSAAERPQWGLANYQRLDYEFFQGFHGYLTLEFLKLDFENQLSTNKAYGIGIQFFPRPHFEINLAWQILTSAAVQGYTDLAFLMLHFYP